MWGLIARADDRGLSHITWEMARHLKPDRILLVDMNDERFPTHHYRYDGLTPIIVEWNVGTPPPPQFFDGLDVVFTAETFYGLEPLAAQHDVKTINYLMPEFYRANDTPPTETWLPTSWLNEHVPHDRIVPLPCPTDRWRHSKHDDRTRLRTKHDTLRVVMPAGNTAMHDRNGAKLFLQALRHVDQQIDVTVWTQDRAFPVANRLPGCVTYRLRRRARNYWEIAYGAHLVVIPRRYGGLCLPAIEALGAGAALAMNDCEPNAMWPIEPISCKPGLAVTAPFGEISTWDSEPRDIAMMLNHFASDVALTRERQDEARTWAIEHSWQNEAEKWRAAITSVGER